jgi:hypothetical protein
MKFLGLVFVVALAAGCAADAAIPPGSAGAADDGVLTGETVPVPGVDGGFPVRDYGGGPCPGPISLFDKCVSGAFASCQTDTPYELASTILTNCQGTTSFGQSITCSKAECYESRNTGAWAAGQSVNLGVVDFSGGVCPGVVCNVDSTCSSGGSGAPDTNPAQQCPGLPGLAGCEVPSSVDHPAAIVINCTGSHEVSDASGATDLEPVTCARWYCPSDGLRVCGSGTPPTIVSMTECPNGKTATTLYASDCMQSVHNGFDGGTSVGRLPPCRVPVDSTGLTLYCVDACP